MAMMVGALEQQSMKSKQGRKTGEQIARPNANANPNPNPNPSNPLALTKLAVFLHTISQAGWNRFSSVYMLSHGFTPIQIGQVKSTAQIAKVLAQPLWGVASDATSPLTAMILSTFLGTVTLSRVRAAIDSRSLSRLVTWRVVRSAVTAASPALDALVLRLVEGTAEGYGRQRLWGSLAWGLASLGAGALLDVFEEGAIFVYTYVTSGLLLVFFLALRRRVIPRNHHRGEPDGGEHKSRQEKVHQTSSDTTAPGIRGRLRAMVRNLSGGSSSPLPMWITLLHNFVYGVIMVLFDSILMLQFERDFGMSRSVQGVFTLVSISSTLPVYHYSHKLRERMGHLGMVLSSIVVAALRLCLTKLACSAVVSDGSRANWLLLLQLLHGYHFAANWVASVELLDALASHRLRSLMQFLLNMAYFTAGSGVGNLWFGYVYEEQSSQAAYSRGVWLCLVDFMLIWALKMHNGRSAFESRKEESMGLSSLI